MCVALFSRCCFCGVKKLLFAKDVFLVICSWPHMRRSFKLIVSAYNGSCKERCLLAWKFIQQAFAKTVYSYTFMSLLNTFWVKEIFEKLSWYARNYFQTMEAQSLVEKNSIWWYLKFMLYTEMLLISLIEFIFQSMSEAPKEKKKKSFSFYFGSCLPFLILEVSNIMHRKKQH